MLKKILITGGAGFIGSHTVEKFSENGYSVVVLDNLSSGSEKNLIQSKNLKLYKVNLEKDNLEELFEAERPDIVIHFAAQTSVNFSTKHPYTDANMNIMATIRLLEVCKKYNIQKFIAASSAAVYGNPQYLPIDENHPTEPISGYGLSKLTMEKYIQLSGIPYIILRFSNVYGRGQNLSKECGVITIFDDAMKNNKPITIYGDGNQIRDFIYVKDIANICVKFVENNISNEIFNVSTNKSVTLNELVTELKSLYNYTQEPIYLPTRRGDIKDSILSNKKITNLFDNFKIHLLNEGLNYEYNICNK